MHAKFSVYKLPFFAHDKRNLCEGAGESDDHALLKAILAGMIREAQWRASIEAMPSSLDSERWRADVLAIEEVGSRRIAFEVQLSSMSISDGIYRTQRYERDNIETLWVSLESAAWNQVTPGIRVRRPSRKLPKQEWAVTDGFRRFHDGQWVRKEVRLQRVVDGYLSRTLVPLRVRDQIRNSESIALVPASDLEVAANWMSDPTKFGNLGLDGKILSQADIDALELKHKIMDEIRDEWTHSRNQKAKEG